jgi:hypothetical protein
MRELDSIAVIGAGRLGTALTAALRAAGHRVEGPLGRGADPHAAVVLLCVPDGEIAAAAAALTRPDRESRVSSPEGNQVDTRGARGDTRGARGDTRGARGDNRGARRLVGHCSGALGLEPLGGHEGFALHPLMTVPAGAPASVFSGAGCAIDGATPRALKVAERLALGVGMRPTRVAEEDRAAYHAAASIASNFLVTLEAAAERLAATAGVERALLAPLVRAAVENWARLGPEAALTGPIARGDEETVARQRAAVEERAPDLLPLFDALADATRELAGAPGTNRAAPLAGVRA